MTLIGERDHRPLEIDITTFGYGGGWIVSAPRGTTMDSSDTGYLEYPSLVWSHAVFVRNLGVSLISHNLQTTTPELARRRQPAAS